MRLGNTSLVRLTSRLTRTCTATTGAVAKGGSSQVSEYRRLLGARWKTGLLSLGEETHGYLALHTWRQPDINYNTPTRFT